MSFLPRLGLKERFIVRCGECKTKYFLTSRELLRAKLESPAKVVSHPLFQ
jgi:hypothetical protein